MDSATEHQRQAPPGSAALKLGVSVVEAHKKPYAYHLQLFARSECTRAQGDSATLMRPLIPIAFWRQQPSNLPQSLPQPDTADWHPWPAHSNNTIVDVKANEKLCWEIPYECISNYYIEDSQQAMRFELHKVTLDATGKKASFTKYCAEANMREAFRDTNGVAELTFGETAIILIDVSEATSREVRQLQPKENDHPPVLFEEFSIGQLSNIAEKLTLRSKEVLSGSRTHTLLSNWGSVLQTAATLLAPALEALPFGNVLVSAATWLYEAVLGRGSVLELGAEICEHVALILRVLGRREVQEKITEDSSTATLLHQLSEVILHTVKILHRYSNSAMPLQLWGARRRLNELQGQSAKIQTIFTTLYQLTSLRTQSDSLDVKKFLTVIGTTKLLTASDLSDIILPQFDGLHRLMEREAERLATTETIAKSVELIQELICNFLTDNATKRVAELAESRKMAHDDLLDEFRLCMEEIQRHAHRTTIEAVASTIRAVLHEALNEWPSRSFHETMNSAWQIAHQKQLATAFHHAHKHLQLIQTSQTFNFGALSTQLDSLSSAASEATLKLGEIHTSLVKSLDLQTKTILDVVRDEAKAVLNSEKESALVLADRIALLDIAFTNVNSTMNITNRLLKNIVSSVKDSSAVTAEIVLSNIPKQVKNLVAPLVNKLENTLKQHRKKSLIDIRNLLSEIISSYLSGEAEQMRQNVIHREEVNANNNAAYVPENLNELRYNPAHDSCTRLSKAEQATFCSLPLDLLQQSLQTLFVELDRGKRSIVTTNATLKRMDMSTTLRIVSSVSTPTTERNELLPASDALGICTGASIEFRDIPSTMDKCNLRSLLIEGTTGIGKSTLLAYLAQIQNFACGIVILVELSELAAYLNGKSPAPGSPSEAISPRELLFVSFGCNPTHATLIDQLYFKIRLGGLKIIWLFDGHNEVNTLAASNRLLHGVLQQIYAVVQHNPNNSNESNNKVSVFAPEDLLVVTSREELGSDLYKAVNIAQITTWTEDESIRFMREAIRQLNAQNTVSLRSESTVNVDECEHECTQAIESKTFGSFCSVPLWLQLLSAHSVQQRLGGKSKPVETPPELMDYCVRWKLKAAREADSGRVWRSDNEIIKVCVQKSIKAEGVYFELSNKIAAEVDLARSGLVFACSACFNDTKVFRFVHMCFLEFFRASFFSSNLKELWTTKVSSNVPIECSDGDYNTRVWYTSPEDIFSISTLQDHTVAMALECCRPLSSSIDVSWLESKAEKEMYESRLQSPLPRYGVKAVWEDSSKPFEVKFTVNKGEERWITLRPTHGTGIVPVRFRLHKSVVVAQQVPLCDIQGSEAFLFFSVISARTTVQSACN